MRDVTPSSAKLKRRVVGFIDRDDRRRSPLSPQTEFVGRNFLKLIIGGYKLAFGLALGVLAGLIVYVMIVALTS